MSASLTPTWVIGSIDLTYEPFMVDRDNTVDIGEPETVIESLPSMLADGDDERITRYGNRVYKIVLYVEGPTLADVAESEALLRAELRKPGLELTHNPGDGWSVDSVFEVRTAVLTPGRRDDHEAHFLRQFTLTLTCAPFARSAEMVTVDAVALGTFTPTTIDDCTSATGWTATVNGAASTPTVTSGVLYATDATEPYQVQMRRAGVVNFSGTRYLSVQVTGTQHVQAYAKITGGAAVQLPLFSSHQLTTGFRRLVFDTAGVSVDDLTFVGSQGKSRAGAPLNFGVAHVERSAVPPLVTPRQSSRVIVPGGTERTPASIHVKSANGTTPNGMTIVHTSPLTDGGFTPDLTRWRVSGNTQTTDANTFSGKTEPIQPSAFLARLPIGAVSNGGYLLAAILKSDTVGTFPINWALDSFIGGTARGVVTNFKPVQFYATNSWHFCTIALETLPTVQSATGQVSAVLWYQGSAATITMDEAFLLPVDDDSALSVVNGVPPHLWLDSPSVMTGSQPRVWVGSAADRSDAYHPGSSLFAPGNHILNPDGTTVFAATQGADYPAVSSTHYPRWHSNAAE